MPITAIPRLAIGDLWQEGLLKASPDYQVESFARLSVTGETASFVKAGLAIQENFLLPLNRHPWHRRHTQSYCVAINLDENRRLLVPCLEIIRFYFGSSSNLLQRLFIGPLREDSLWSLKQFNPDNRHLHLVLASGLSGFSASDIGRVAGSAFAWRSAAGIYASCQKASAKGESIHPYTGFPFEGLTDLTASGIWLPFGDHENSTFLAYRIRSCSHPFPFQSLSYEAGDRKALRTASGTGDSKQSRYAQSSSRNRKTEISDLDPGKNKPQRKATITIPHRFPDLLRKSVWRDKIESAPSPDVYLRHDDGNIEQVALGESDCSMRIYGIDTEHASGNNSPREMQVPLPWFVRMGLRNIEAEQPNKTLPMQIKVVCPTGKQVPVFSLPRIIDGDGVISEKSLLLDKNGKTRQRRGCFAELSREDTSPKSFLILEGKMPTSAPKCIPITSLDLKSVTTSLENFDL